MTPAQIGRFVVLERIGAGAMGEVWSAHDPELDRRVAIKRIRGAGDGERRARLLREAQALARLSHPNIVQVFEVGVAGDEVYIAMEQIDGPTLRQWLAIARPQAAVLAMFEQTGRGLAAAHAAGLVHRDFKPDNVLVGKDGRARVVDFGLARATGGSDEAPVSITHESDPLLVELTATGEVLGTPAYMAPEQFMGEVVDARSDQFAFCVALFEALYGVRPFAGATRMAIAHAITTGEIVTPPIGRDVPPWLHREVIRGLAIDPPQRHADVSALLDALARDPARRRRRIAVAALAVATIAVPAWLVTRETTGPEPCAAGRAALDPAWSPPRRAALFDNLGSRRLPPALIEATAASLDAWADQWLAGYRDACEATHVHGTQSEAALDRRMTCLGDRRTAFAAAVEVIAQADLEALARADAVVASLPAIDSCADDAFVSARAPIDDPALARTVDAITADIARSHALQAAGNPGLARSVAGGAVERATAAGHADTIARAMVARGLAERSDGDPRIAARTLEEALWGAMASRDDDTAFAAAVGLVEIIGHQLRDDAGAQPWIREASALVDRATIDPARRWQFHVDVGTVHWTHARLDDAEREFTAALTALGETGTHDHRESRILNNLGAVALERDDLGRAQYLFMRCTASDIARAGAEHLIASDDFGNLGTVAFRSGDFGLARAWFERSIAVRRKHLGEHHPQVLGMLGNLAGAHLGAGEIEPAVALLREQVAAWEAREGERHPAYYAAEFNLSLALHELGRYGDAVDPATTAVIGLTAQLGPAHPQTVAARDALTGALAAAGIDARAAVQQARQLAASDPAVLAQLDAWLAAQGMSEAMERGRLRAGFARVEGEAGRVP